MGVEAANKVNKENRYNPDYMRRKKMTKIRMALDLYEMEPRSLSAPLRVRDPKSGNYGDVLVDTEAQSPHQLLAAKETRYRLRAIMHEALTPREERVLLLRFVGELTLDEIGQKLDLSRERIRQVEFKAIGKLRRAMGKP